MEDGDWLLIFFFFFFLFFLIFFLDTRLALNTWKLLLYFFQQSHHANILAVGFLFVLPSIANLTALFFHQKSIKNIANYSMWRRKWKYFKVNLRPPKRQSDVFSIEL